MCNGFAYGYLNRHDPCCGAYCHVGIGPFCCVFFLMTWKGWLGSGEFYYSSLEASVWGEWFGWTYQKVFQKRPELFGVWGMFEGSEFALPHVVPHYQLTVSSWLPLFIHPIYFKIPVISLGDKLYLPQLIPVCNLRCINQWGFTSWLTTPICLP